MSDTNRIIGQLQAFQKEHANGMKELKEEMREDIAELKKEVKKLNEAYWKLVGGSTVVSAVIGVVVHGVLK